MTELSPHETTLELLGHQQAILSDVRQLHSELVELWERAHTPATLSTVTLTAASPVDEDFGNIEAPARSIGILNPSGVTIAAGIGGGSATIAANAVPVPPFGLLVLPVAVAQLEIAADPAELGADAAVIFVLRFKHVQPAFLGVGA